jgi:cation diffusion facilitator family transporter
MTHFHDHHVHGHDHHHHHHGHHHAGAGGGNQKALIAALSITVGIMLLEFVGGLATNSLALLSDSGHMFNDAASLGLSLVAFWFAAKPASAQKSYGFYRFEILAALVNGVTLFAVAGFVIWEAVERLREPQAVASGAMLGIALIGLLANGLSAWVLLKKGDVKENINLRSAYLHVLGDALGSVGAIAAGVLMLIFEWHIADPIISVLVALLILKSAWAVTSQAVHILMEGTPSAIDHAEVKRELQRIDGVLDVHDLHIWSITSGMNALSCHLLVRDDTDGQRVLQEAIETLERRFHLAHATVQVETSRIRHHPLHD